MSQLTQRNLERLGALFGNQEYTSRGRANTSRLGSDGIPEADPSNGLPAGYIWIRREGSRAETRALIGSGLRGWERIGNLLVEVGINRCDDDIAPGRAAEVENPARNRHCLLRAEVRKR